MTIQIIREGVAPNVRDKSIVLSPRVRGGELIFRDDVVIAQGRIDWQTDVGQFLGDVSDGVQRLLFAEYFLLSVGKVVSTQIVWRMTLTYYVPPTHPVQTKNLMLS